MFSQIRKINWNIIYPIIIAIYIFTCWNTGIDFTSGAYPFHTFNRIARISLACIVLFKIYFLDQSNIKTLLIYTGVLICFGINMFITGQILMFCAVVCALGAKNVDYHNIAKATFYTILITMITTFILYACGLLVKYSGVRNLYIDRIKNSIPFLRNSYGFYHPNRFGLWCFLLLISGTQAYYDKIKVKHIWLGFIYTFLFFFLSNSRASTIAAIVYLLLLLYSKNSEIKGKNTLKFALSCIILSLIIIAIYYFLSINYGDNKLIYNLNQLLSCRLMLSQEGLFTEKITLFGLSTASSISLESLYTSFLINNGIIPSILWLFGVCYATLRAGKAKYYSIVILLLPIVLFSAMESNMTCHYNLSIYAVSCLLNQKTEQ